MMTARNEAIEKERKDLQKKGAFMDEEFQKRVGTLKRQQEKAETWAKNLKEQQIALQKREKGLFGNVLEKDAAPSGSSSSSSTKIPTYDLGNCNSKNASPTLAGAGQSLADQSQNPTNQNLELDALKHELNSAKHENERLQKKNTAYLQTQMSFKEENDALKAERLRLETLTNDFEKCSAFEKSALKSVTVERDQEKKDARENRIERDKLQKKYDTLEIMYQDVQTKLEDTMCASKYFQEKCQGLQARNGSKNSQHSGGSNH